jgi:hypothetical protein
MLALLLLALEEKGARLLFLLLPDLRERGEQILEGGQPRFRNALRRAFARIADIEEPRGDEGVSPPQLGWPVANSGPYRECVR